MIFIISKATYYIVCSIKDTFRQINTLGCNNAVSSSPQVIVNIYLLSILNHPHLFCVHIGSGRW